MSDDHNFENDSFSSSYDTGDHTDDGIQAEIQRRIELERFLKDKGIEAIVYHGKVTLRGTLPTVMVRDLLVDIVSEVPGVRNIDADLLTIGDEAPQDQAAHNGTDGSYVEETGTTVDYIIPAAIPVTGEMVDVMSDDTVNLMDALDDQSTGGADATAVTDTGTLAASLSEGMAVVDRAGHTVGQVKIIRPTDFQLDRRFARDLYVPYTACTIDGDKVVLNVLADEINQQGWARPGSASDPYTPPMV